MSEKEIYLGRQRRDGAKTAKSFLARITQVSRFFVVALRIQASEFSGRAILRRNGIKCLIKRPIAYLYPFQLKAVLGK